MAGTHLYIRIEYDERLMRIFEKVGPNKFFEISMIQCFLYRMKIFFITKRCFRLTVIEPTAHAADTIDKPLRCCAEVRFTKAELEKIDRSLKKFAINAIVYNLFQSLLHHTLEILCIFFIAVVENDAEKWL